MPDLAHLDDCLDLQSAHCHLYVFKENNRICKAR
jgi:hypothetical protein